MQESSIQAVGNLVADPTLRTLTSGTSVAHFRIASTPRWRDRDTGGWRDGNTTFYNVSCWRALAENAHESLHKGDRVLVVGRLRQRSYVATTGEEREVWEIDADVVGPDLNRHAAAIRKVQRFARADGGAADSAGSPPGAVDAPHAGAQLFGAQQPGGPSQAPASAA